MAEISLHGTPIQTCGDLPKVDSAAPDFSLVNTKLEDVSLDAFPDKKKLLNIIPSIDTPVCEKSTKAFSDAAKERPQDLFLIVSADLPFAYSRFFMDEGAMDNVVSLSMMRSDQFARDYGILITTGPLAGICARAVVVLDTENKIVHTELVSEIGSEPDYDAALRGLDAI